MPAEPLHAEGGPHIATAGIQENYPRLWCLLRLHAAALRDSGPGCRFFLLISCCHWYLWDTGVGVCMALITSSLKKYKNNWPISLTFKGFGWQLVSHLLPNWTTTAPNYTRYNLLFNLVSVQDYKTNETEFRHSSNIDTNVQQQYQTTLPLHLPPHHHRDWVYRWTVLDPHLLHHI